MRIHTIEQPVRYVETDRMGVVHHSTYLFWFEVGRTALLEAAGFPYHELEKSGTMFPVIEYTCRITGAADYGDRVRIDTSIQSLRSRTVVFGYRALIGETAVATGTSRHIAVDADRQPRRMAAPLLEALKPYVKGGSRND